MEIRDLFLGLTHQAIYCQTPASLALPLSHRLAAFYCLPLLSTFTVYCSVLCFCCVYGDIVFPPPQSMTGIVSLFSTSIQTEPFPARPSGKTD
jgi:hypothetical protein